VKCATGKGLKKWHPINDSFENEEGGVGEAGRKNLKLALPNSGGYYISNFA